MTNAYEEKQTNKILEMLEQRDSQLHADEEDKREYMNEPLPYSTNRIEPDTDTDSDSDSSDDWSWREGGDAIISEAYTGQQNGYSYEVSLENGTVCVTVQLPDVTCAAEIE